MSIGHINFDSEPFSIEAQVVLNGTDHSYLQCSWTTNLKNTVASSLSVVFCGDVVLVHVLGMF